MAVYHPAILLAPFLLIQVCLALPPTGLCPDKPFVETFDLETQTIRGYYSSEKVASNGRHHRYIDEYSMKYASESDFIYCDHHKHRSSCPDGHYQASSLTISGHYCNGCENIRKRKCRSSGFCGDRISCSSNEELQHYSYTWETESEYICGSYYICSAHGESGSEGCDRYYGSSSQAIDKYKRRESTSHTIELKSSEEIYYSRRSTTAEQLKAHKHGENEEEYYYCSSDTSYYLENECSYSYHVPVCSCSSESSYRSSYGSCCSSSLSTLSCGCTFDSTLSCDINSISSFELSSADECCCCSSGFDAISSFSCCNDFIEHKYHYPSPSSSCSSSPCSSDKYSDPDCGCL